MTRISRSHLLSLISEASELEHSLACSYLFAAFSLKRSQADGLTWREEQAVRRWAGQVYFVASQEMLHLAQVWNLAMAIGGTPYFSRPAFPQPKGYLPIDADLSLEPYSLQTLNRFLQWESPGDIKNSRNFRLSPTHAEIDAKEEDETDNLYTTVGELYGRIETIIDELPEKDLFIGNASLQVDSKLVDFPDLVRVTDRASAKFAVSRIREQGEGRQEDRDDCHFGVFLDLQAELEKSSFDAAFPVLNNPSLTSSSGVTRVTDLASRAAMRLFDDVYGTMLRLLAWVFGPGDPRSEWTQAVAKVAIASMPIVLKPMGEIIATFPSGISSFNAGAPFSPMRNVPLPSDENLARRLVLERMTELVNRAGEYLRLFPQYQDKLGWLPGRLRELMNIL